MSLVASPRNVSLSESRPHSVCRSVSLVSERVFAPPLDRMTPACGNCEDHEYSRANSHLWSPFLPEAGPSRTRSSQEQLEISTRSNDTCLRQQPECQFTTKVTSIHDRNHFNPRPKFLQFTTKVTSIYEQSHFTSRPKSLQQPKSLQYRESVASQCQSEVSS